eukprot:475262-Pleurochrysis_carterae.AAC.1
MLDVRKPVSTTYELEGDGLEILLMYNRIETLRELGRSLRAHDDGILPNAAALVRRSASIAVGTRLKKVLGLLMNV